MGLWLCTKNPYKVFLCLNKGANCLNFLHGLYQALICIIRLEEGCDFYMF